MTGQVRWLIEFAASGFYSGRARRAPGTCGTVAVAVGWWLLGPLVGGGAASWVVALLFVPIAVWIAREASRREPAWRGGAVDGGSDDPQWIVIDEFAGYLVAIAGFPVEWGTTLLAFLLFRLFDITKPPPIRRIEALPNGWGIVLDDVLAGVYANIALRGVSFFFFS